QVSGGVASVGSPVTPIARYSNHIDLLVIGTDNRVYSTWWHDTTGWAAWARPGPGGRDLAHHRTHRYLYRGLRRHHMERVVGCQRWMVRLVPARRDIA